MNREQPVLPTVKLISFTKDPIATILAVWETAKTKHEVLTIEEIANRIERDHSYADSARGEFLNVISMDIPVMESIVFTFNIENMTISFREQMVRSRTNSYWIQSGRVTDYSKFVLEEMYRVPASVLKTDEGLRWHKAMEFLHEAFTFYTKEGVPSEDARDLIPLGALHRGTITINLRNLRLLVSKRSCWVAQIDNWEPIIKGMIDELCEKVDPIFRNLIYPPCVNKNGDYHACKYVEIMEQRARGEDPYPVCPLWDYKENGETFDIMNVKRDPVREDRYTELWQHQARTWQKL